MNKSQETKSRFLQAMAEHVLQHGLNTASLRPLAKAANTSDRMLIYHFGSKDELIAELLQYLSDHMAQNLDLVLPPTRSETLKQCMSQIMELLRTPSFRSYMKLWLEILAEAGQGNSTHHRTGKIMVNSYLEWLKKHIPADTENPDRTVALLLTLIEGIIVLDTVGKADVADLAIEELFG